MFWWLVAGIIGVIGIANRILSNLRKTAAAERQRWENEYQAVERQIEQYDREIQYKLRSAQNTIDFHVLTNLHFESMKIADHAYELLKDSRIALDAIGHAIVETGKEKNRLIAEKRRTRDRRRQNELEQEITALMQLSRQLYPDKDQLKAQRDHFYFQVKQFNARTHSLKLAIRDRTGAKGKDWYRRLEERTAIREENKRRRAAGLPPLPIPKKKKAIPKPKQPTKSRVRGTVKWFDDKKGFGFIMPDDGRSDVHVSRKNLNGARTLQENDRVEFERRSGNKGPWARNVKKI